MAIKDKLKKVKQKLTPRSSSSEGERSSKNKDDEENSDNDYKSSNNTSKTSKSSKRSSESSNEKSGVTDISEDEGSDIELLPDDGKNFGKRKLQDTDKPSTWNILIRVIEAKDVSTGSARVRTVFDGQSKMTRTVTHAIPKWRQNILYTQKNVSLDKLASKILTLKLQRPTTLGETSIGEFSCYLSEVIHSPDRSVVAKWVALGFPGMENEESDDFACENCGFLKVTLSVYRLDESPPQLIDDDGKEQIWSGAHLSDYTLKIRLFSVEQLIRKMINEKKLKKRQKFYVTVECGGHKTETTHETACLDDESKEDKDNNSVYSVKFQQEIYVPIQWPTVISELIFSLYSKRGRSKTCIGKATIPMKLIYEPGETGFLPTFGPSYVNVFDCERVTRFSLFSKKNRGAQQDGSRFIARLFLSIDCVEFMGESAAHRMHLDHSPIMEAESISNETGSYNAFCSMSALNMINPQFASDPIYVMMSIGSHGSISSEEKTCSSSTLPAEPNWDGCKYFSMPWGNLRPVTEVHGSFESIDYRIEVSNVLMKATNMLDKMIWEIQRIGNGAIDHVASTGIDTLDNLKEMIKSTTVYLNRVSNLARNDLDRSWLSSRKEKIVKLKEHFEKEGLEVDYSDGEVDAKLLRTLLQIRSLTVELAEDVQISIPPVVIKMMSYGKLIGFAKIPISEIFQSNEYAESGEWCGRTRPINIQWPTLLDQRNRKKEFVAVLHAKMWFGPKNRLNEWKNHVEPAEVRRFVEVYEMQSKGLTQKWKDNDTDLYDGNGEKIDGAPSLDEDRHPIGPWIVMNTREMFVPELGYKTIYDKLFEVQKKTDGRWKLFQYTDIHGKELNPEALEKASIGLRKSSWIADKLRNNGDEKGYVYSTSGALFGDQVNNDRKEMEFHKFRMRCVKRPRKIEDYDKKLDDLEFCRSQMEDTNWEYTSVKKEGPYHDGEYGADKYRRRRYIREVEQNDSPDEDPRFRLYEYQAQTAKWQLRCYIMWANDLLPVVKNSSRAFVRVSFVHQTKQTLLVDNSQNPLWSETIMFKSILIAGGTHDIMRNPPVISVEVVGECTNNEEANLGKFETTPTVICSNRDHRGTPRWFPLRFSKGRTRGAVLACFELYQEEEKDLIPLEPGKKHNAKERNEIPLEFRPQFDKYHIQFLCWGVRNLKKHKLLSVRRPFVELAIGDQEFTLDPLKDVRRNPNFPEPMIVFAEVNLPSALELSPPFIINLFDSRSFNRKPLVGCCLISDLHKYVSYIIPKTKSDQAEKWEELEDLIAGEHEKIAKMVKIPSLTKDIMVPLDWWSRYYASMSQFHRSPGYPESGMEYLRVFRLPLEEMNGYNHFTDFLDTFPFVKSMKGDFDDPEEKEKAGELKCRLLISKIKKDKPPAAINPVVDFVGPTECVVRVYIIEANGLISNARKGRIDSYVKLRCGKQKVNLKKNYRAECCDPIFGERIDMMVTIPLEKDLTITVMDKRRILSDQEIGSTTIDLENRLLTKWRATCGLSGQYTVHGEHQWRDQMTPLEILKSYCYKMMLSTPKIETRKSDEGEECGITIEQITFWFSDVMHVTENEEVAMLNAQREKAGKEEGDGKNETDRTSESWDDVDMEMEKEKESWEKRRSKERKMKKDSLQKAETADGELRKKAKRAIRGTQLETIALFILRQINLVPEHVESRPLFSDKGGKTKNGELRMFVDIFPKEYGSIPAPFNVAPRKPVSYQLRVAVMDVRGAIPVKRSFAEPVSDLYVKAFINGMPKGHKTDTHFRVLDGTGEFNWRFLLNFDYNPWEKKVVAYTKTRYFRKPVEELVDPILVVELWDKNKFRKDRLLGDIELDLLAFIEGIGSPSDVGVYSKKSRKRDVNCPKCCTSRGCLCRCCIFCYETKCLCGRRKIKKKPFPKPVLFVEPEGYDETVNIFEARNLYGWWPMLTDEYPHDEPQNAKKKNDDVGKDPKWIMGLIEMDMMLLTKQESDQEPAGKKRSEPNHSPFLEKPNRKTWANSWLVSRIKPCIKYFWHYYGLQILLWILIIALLALTIFALIQTWPIILIEIFKGIF